MLQVTRLVLANQSSLPICDTNRQTTYDFKTNKAINNVCVTKLAK